jgi:hypothetical protein
MSSAHDRAFFEVSDITDRDLDYLTDLRDRIASPKLGTTPDEHEAIRRMYVRVFITMVEGSVATIKSKILWYTASLNDAERAVLRDVTFELKENGKPCERVLHPPLLSSLKFAFRMFASVHKLATRPDYSTSGWKAMQNVMILRNRLTHPKTPEDLRVTPTDLATVDEAELWFRQTHNALLNEYIEQLQKQLDALSGFTGA